MGRPSTRWTWCEPHHKRAYLDQAAADDALRCLPDGDVMQAYRCGVHPETLHVGHISRDTLALMQVNKAGGRK